MTHRFSRAAHIALVHALLASTVIPSILVVGPAEAQQTAGPRMSVPLIRGGGEWRTEVGIVRFEGEQGTLKGYIEQRPGLIGYLLVLNRGADRKSLEGTWSATDASEQRGKNGQIRVVLSDDGNAISVERRGLELLKGRDKWTGERNIRINDPIWAAKIEQLRALSGTWETSQGTLQLRLEGDHLFGTLRPAGADSDEAAGTLVVALRAAQRPSVLEGAATDRNPSHYPAEADIEWEVGADGASFIGSLTSWFSGKPIKTAWTGKRTRSANGTVVGQTPVVAPGTPSPRAGYKSCGWCEVSIIDADVVPVQSAVIRGKFVPTLNLQVSVHNLAPYPMGLNPDHRGWSGDTDAGELPIDAHNSGSTTNRPRFVVIGQGNAPGETAAQSQGPFLPTPGSFERPFDSAPLRLQSGDEARLRYSLRHLPANPTRIDFRLSDDTVVAFDHKPWVCRYFALEQQLAADDKLAYPARPLPPSCGGQSPAPAGPTQPMEAPNPASQPPASAPVAQPAPATAPAVPQQGPASPSVAMVQAGLFHPLEGFDVRLDEARAGRDGRLHVFLTARNKSGRDFYMSSGPFRILASDADGVGVEAESRPYRATGEELTPFAQVPTIPTGGELRMHYVLDLPKVHGPLVRLSVRESGKKVLHFDASAADPNPSPEPAPAQGRGIFKRLSKFDVRIDKVAPGSDGRLEAFLTLRNATREVQSTSKGAIQLSGTSQDGGKVTSASELYSVRGERGRYDELPTLVYAEPGQEMRLRYVFDEAISGPITISDGTVSQTFTPG